MNTQTINLSKVEADKLQKVAVLYGFSPDEIARRIIAEATKSLLSIPEESLNNYDNKEEILKDLKDSLVASKKGKLLTSLSLEE